MKQVAFKNTICQLICALQPLIFCAASSHFTAISNVWTAQPTPAINCMAAFWLQGTIQTQQEADLPPTSLKKAFNSCLSKSQMTHETHPGCPATADEEEQQTSAVPQNLGHYWGLGSECSMVWWFHSFYKLQQWPAFSVTVVGRLGQPPYSPSLL